MKFVFFGAPGAGKGTIAKMAKDDFGIPQISTGDLFREAIKNKTELGLKVSDIINKGNLVPDELTISIVKERVIKPDCKNGYILDGFPRTEFQAVEWEKVNPINKAIYFDISDESVKKRLCGRRGCPKCGSIYNIFSNKPKKDNVCDNDGESLATREDDSDKSIENRLKVYHSQTEPLISFYKKLGKMVSIDAEKSPQEIYSELKKKIK